MKLIRVSLTAVLALAVGAAMPAFAQHDHDGDEKHDNGNHYGQQKHDDRYEHDTKYVRYEEHADHHHKRIPEDHFRAHFGREHRFHIMHPVVVAGHSRFQYDGYWFAFNRPLPPGWRYTDEVYVDSVNDNYFLYSPAHPGVQLSINLVL